jgi:hypothetical protein
VVTSDSGIERYKDEFNVKASEFKQYELQLTGQPFIAYAWQIPEKVSGIASSPDTATITVTLPNGKTFTAEDTIF